MDRIKPATSLSDTVEYHPYDPQLPAVFDQIKRLIQRAAPDLRVEHVGSSSIPGVGGRNVLDIVIPVEGPAQASIEQHLYGLGFQDAPFRHFLPVLVGVVSEQGKDYSILLYVLPPDSDIYQGWITFRDYLRAHPEEAQAYDRVKQQAIAAGTVDGQRYQQAKTPFLVALTEKIQKRRQA